MVTEQLYLLGGDPGERFNSRVSVARLRKRSEIHKAIVEAPQKTSLWISTEPEATDDLLREVFGSRIPRVLPRLGRLLLLYPPRLGSLPVLEELFNSVAWGTIDFRHLPFEELVDVISAEESRTLIIGGFVDPKTATLIMYRGDFDRIAVPLSVFKATGSGPKPDPSELSFTDFGQTVCLGDYEAATDAILYEVDPEYRRQINAKRRKEEKSFGASLRRLRVLKGLRQSDFNSIPAKTIARIERGEVGKPRTATLQKIARHLEVDSNDIETY